MYFSKIPNVYAPFTIGGVEQYIQIKDITVNVRFVSEFLSNVTVYDLYDIKDGETPEILAEHFYGTPTYHWAIMLANDRHDYINDFPIASNVFEEYVYQKYNVPFDAVSWSYVGSIITVTKPNHGLLLATNTNVTLSNAATIIDDVITAVTGTYQLSAVTTNTFSFDHITTLTGAPSITMTVTPSGLTNYTHHYETESGLTVDSDWVGRLAISNYTYEDKLNETKRTIKVISQNVIEQVAQEYVRALSS